MLSTLVEAVVLVFLVMFLFLQNIRYTLIPTIVVPVALLGTFARCCSRALDQHADDVRHGAGDRHPGRRRHRRGRERRTHHGEEGLPPKEATRKAMGQITGAIIGITLVLVAVFVPMAFFPGSVGIIYRQFSVTMVAAIGFSAFLALSLTPALCATLLKPVTAGHGHARKGVFGWFNRGFDAVRDRYKRIVGRRSIAPGGCADLRGLIGLGWAFVRLPGGFLPVDDQGYMTTDVQLPPDSTYARTEAAVEAVEKYLARRADVDNVTFLTGFSFSGQGRTPRWPSSR